MAVSNYINDLLYRYECVILPGFGAFITQHHSARIYNGNQFHPPQKTVSFNGQLTKNDGLLAHYVMEVEQISYSTAIQKLDEFVGDLHKILSNEKEVEFTNLGSFTLTEEDKLQFEPIAKINYLKEAFGLSKFSSAEIVRETYKKQAVALEEKAPIAFTPERREAKPYLKYAAIGLLALGLSGFTGLNIYSNKVTEHNLAEQLKAASQLEDQIQKATFIIDNPLPAVTLNVNKQEGNYHIVAGAFRLEENAEKKVHQLRKEGFAARKIPVNRYGLHQVIYSSFKDKRDAVNNLWKIKRTSNEKAWLWVKEL